MLLRARASASSFRKDAPPGDWPLAAASDDGDSLRRMMTALPIETENDSLEPLEDGVL